MSTGIVVTCAISTVRVIADVAAASSGNTTEATTIASTTSSAFTGIPSSPATAPTTTATTTSSHPIASDGMAVPPRISGSVSSPVRSRLRTNSSRRPTYAVTRL